MSIYIVWQGTGTYALSRVKELAFNWKNSAIFMGPEHSEEYIIQYYLVLHSRIPHPILQSYNSANSPLILAYKT